MEIGIFGVEDIMQIQWEKIREYINNQLHEDYIADQISLKEYIDPFTGNPVKKNR